MTPSNAFQLSNPEGLYDPSGNAYSHVAEVRADSRLLFIAGQGGEDSQGQLSPVFAEQARQALANLERALASKGASLAQVFKLTLLIVEHSEAPAPMGDRGRQGLGAAHETDLHTDTGAPAGAGRHAGGDRSSSRRLAQNLKSRHGRP